jgi:hypothetical protein
MQTPCKQLMLKHCSSIHAQAMQRAMLKQCSTYKRTYSRTTTHLEHSTHLRIARRGAE